LQKIQFSPVKKLSLCKQAGETFYPDFLAKKWGCVPLISAQPHTDASLILWHTIMYGNILSIKYSHGINISQGSVSKSLECAGIIQ